jgi:hypothetical protein
MSSIRELSFDEIASVSGGNGADSADRDRALRNKSTGSSGNNSNKIYSSPSTTYCVDNMLVGAAGGAVLGGFPGAVVGLATGAYAGQCLAGSSNGNSNGGNAGSNKCSGNSAAASCKK